MNHSTSHPTIRRVLCTRGALGVTVCPLCAALVLTDGLEQHARVHAAEFDRRPDPTTTDPSDPGDLSRPADATHRDLRDDNLSQGSAATGAE